MKKNIITYILIFVVIAVWGIIFYRIFFPANKNNGEQASANIQVSKTENKRAGLSLNYKNPFRIENSGNKNNKEAPKIEIKEEPPAFKYKGLVKGAKNKVIVIENNGITQIIPLRDNILGFKIISINKDSVVVVKTETRYSLIKN